MYQHDAKNQYVARTAKYLQVLPTQTGSEHLEHAARRFVCAGRC
jgi:hypothetical protein